MISAIGFYAKGCQIEKQMKNEHQKFFAGFGSHFKNCFDQSKNRRNRAILKKDKKKNWSSNWLKKATTSQFRIILEIDLFTLFFRNKSFKKDEKRPCFTSLRDGYESDSGLSYRSKTANFSQFNNGPAKAQEAPATFVFDPMQSRGRGAKMFERQKNRMGKLTRDHREDYEQFKGQQTKNESFQHQVRLSAQS